MALSNILGMCDQGRSDYNFYYPEKGKGAPFCSGASLEAYNSLGPLFRQLFLRCSCVVHCLLSVRSEAYKYLLRQCCGTAVFKIWIIGVHLHMKSEI